MMNAGPDNANETKSPQVTETKEKKQRHRARWIIFGVAVFVVLFALFVSVVPEFAARRLMESELAKIGIQTTGTETLYLNPWRGEIRLGPVEFWSEGAERGQIGTIGAKLSLATLFKKRALVETFILEGIDLVVDKRDDGIFINGVSLQQFAAPEEEVAEEIPEEEKSSWGAGIDKFEFLDSQIILRNFIPESELVVEIDRLFVSLFHSWEPEESGVIDLRGKIDGAPVVFNGTARPFANDIQISFKASVTDLPVADALDYGRIGLVVDRKLFERREGTGSTVATYSGVLQEDGSVNVNGEQTVVLDNLHLVAGAGGESIQVKKAEITLFSSESYSPDGRIEAAGNWRSKVSGLKFAVPGGPSAEITTVSTNMDGFFFEMNADKSISAYLPHQSLVKGLLAQPNPETSLKFAEGAFGLENLNLNQTPEGEINLTGGVSLKLKDVGANSGPDTQVTAGSVVAGLSDLSVKRDLEGQLRVSATPTVDIGSAEVAGAAPMTVDQVSLVLSSFVADVAGQAVSVQSSGSASVAAFQLAVPGADGQPGTDASVRSVKVDLQNFSANLAGGDIKVNGAVGSEMSGLAASVPQPGGAMTVAVDQVQTSFPSLRAEMAGGATSVNLTGATDIAKVSVAAPGAEGQPGADVSVEAVRFELQNVVANMAGGDTKVNGAVGSEISGLAANLNQPGGAMTVEADKLQTSFSSMNAEVSGGATSVKLAGETSLAGFKTIIPSVDGRPEITVGLGSLDVAMKEIAASLAGEAPQWNVAADVAVKNVSTKLKTAESASTVDIASVSVTGAKADQALAIAVGAIVAAGVDADLVDKDLKAFGGGATKKASAKSSSPKGPEPKVRLDRLAVGKNSVIEFTDTSVDPPVIVVVDLDEVNVKNIDTGNPSKRTDLDLKARINESSTLGVTGWATPLKSTPDFSLNVNLKALPLPAYSSYVSNAIGWHLDGGDLSTTVNATANNNALKGQVGVLVDNLFLNPVTAADGEKLEKQIGVPVQFAVGILKDDQGRINLDLPLSGTIDKPEVDYSSVIRKAISGFLGSIFGSDSFQGADGFKLQPVVFAPGSAELNEVGKQSAANYVTMLEKKSSLKLGVCGRANVQDFVALFGSRALPPSQVTATSATGGAPAAAAPRTISSDQAKALVKLAMERTNVVRAYLVDEKGISTDRIVQCRVTYDIKDTQPPRAQFAM